MPASSAPADGITTPRRSRSPISASSRRTSARIPTFPFAIDEPGIGGVAADLGLPIGATLSLNLASGLRIWNGNGFDADYATSMFIDYGPESIDSLTGGSIGLLISDDYDLHPIYSIDPNSIAGSYLLEFNVAMDGFATSDSFWIAFNYGLDDEDFEASVEWVEGNLVPAPGALGLLAMAGLASPSSTRLRSRGMFRSWSIAVAGSGGASWTRLRQSARASAGPLFFSARFGRAASHPPSIRLTATSRGDALNAHSRTGVSCAGAAQFRDRSRTAVRMAPDVDASTTSRWSATVTTFGGGDGHASPKRACLNPRTSRGGGLMIRFPIAWSSRSVFF